MQQHRGGAAIANAACGRSRDVLSDSIQGAALRAEAVLGPQLLLVLGWHKAFLPSLCFAAQVGLGVRVVRFSREECWARCKTCICLRKWLLSYRELNLQCAGKGEFVLGGFSVSSADRRAEQK